jgi:exopolyphosphatase/guanosine-5'-triphosphate,3'-diphosphate pyrophosphatase
MRLAVVDIGTNSTRLLVADVADGAIAELDRRTTITRLGERVDTTGRLCDAAQARVFAALDEYARAIDTHVAERSTAVMTSAVRDAANGAEFRAAVQERYGLPGRTLSGDEEAALTFLGATAARDPANDDALLVIDIGGGSTELVIGEGRDVRFHVSTQAGVVRHTERHVHSDPPAAEELQALAADAREVIEAAVPQEARHVDGAVAVAGTATTVAAIELGLEPYDSGAVEGHEVPLARLEELLARLAAMTLEERLEVPGLPSGRAPTIVAGIVILIEILHAFGLEGTEVSDRDILWGAALELASSR